LEIGGGENKILHQTKKRETKRKYKGVWQQTRPQKKRSTKIQEIGGKVTRKLTKVGIRMAKGGGV